MILLFILVMFLFPSHPGLSCVIVLFPHIVFLVPNSCCVGVNNYFFYVIPVSESTPKPYLVFSYFYIFFLDSTINLLPFAQSIQLIYRLPKYCYSKLKPFSSLLLMFSYQ